MGFKYGIPTSISGISFRVNSTTGASFKTISGVNKTNEDIIRVLSTRKGQVFLRPDFGTKLYDYLFEPNDFILADLIEMEIKDCLEVWVPWISILNVTVVPDSNNVHVTINYGFKNTNIQGSVEYSFSREVV